MCKQAWDYNFSSAKYRVGKRLKDPLLSRDTWHYNNKEWQDLLSDEIVEIDKIRSTTKTGRPLGNSDFIKKLEQQTNRILHPQKPGPKNN